MCKFILGTESNLLIRPINVRYKIQDILIHSNKDLLGGEVLIDSMDMCNLVNKRMLNNYLEDPVSVRNILRFLIDYASIKSNLKLKKEMKIFINVERSVICDTRLINDIKAASDLLKNHKISLVIEITERNRCGRCKRIPEGLALFNLFEIPLAVDDYDIYNGDFRFEEVESGYYDYIKVRAPKCVRELEQLVSFKNSGRSELLIVEQIEHLDDDVMMDFINPYAVQGFYYRAERKMG